MKVTYCRQMKNEWEKCIHHSNIEPNDSAQGVLEFFCNNIMAAKLLSQEVQNPVCSPGQVSHAWASVPLQQPFPVSNSRLSKIRLTCPLFGSSTYQRFRVIVAPGSLPFVYPDICSSCWLV